MNWSTGAGRGAASGGAANLGAPRALLFATAALATMGASMQTGAGREF